MKLILRDYISLLKEDQELDTLLTDLLFSMNVVPLTKAQKGRQYGVDVSAVGIDPEDNKKKVFLCAVKQGDLSRSTWDSGVNAVRPTLNEIKDTYISTALSKTHQKLPKRIIVCCNGDLAQNVNVNWTQYINNNTTDGIEFDFWGIDKLVYYLETYLLSDALFPPRLRKLLSQTLSFIDLPDYDLRHFCILIHSVLNEGQQRSKKQVLKKIRLVKLCLSILLKWCQDVDNLRPAVIASERVLLNIWDWMKKDDMLSKNYILQEFYQLNSYKREINKTYFNKIQAHCYVQDSLQRYCQSHLEYTLITWEHIGFIAISGLMEFYEYALFSPPEATAQQQEHAKVSFQEAYAIAEGLEAIIVTNPSSLYPKYDEHCIEISLGLSLLFFTKKHEVAKQWLELLIVRLNDVYVFSSGFLPLFRTDYEKLVEIDIGNEKPEASSSMLITMLAEWCVILNLESSYHNIRTLIGTTYPSMNLQLWFPDEETESKLFVSNATEETGKTKHSIKLYDNFADYKDEMQKELELFSEEKNMALFKSVFSHLGYIASRHFRSYLLPIYWRGLAKAE